MARREELRTIFCRRQEGCEEFIVVWIKESWLPRPKLRGWRFLGRVVLWGSGTLGPPGQMKFFFVASTFTLRMVLCVIVMFSL
jgi:hypothetical protein